MSNMKYKTILCKHFETSKGCVYKDRCQFAHGIQELRSGMNLGNVSGFFNLELRNRKHSSFPAKS
jgi:hypothetical protein